MTNTTTSALHSGYQGTARTQATRNHGSGNHRPKGAALSGRARLTLLAMCLGAAMTFLEITASITSLSAIQADLGVPAASLVWIPSAYTLLVASLVLSAGTLGNRFGRKRMFCIGVIALALGSATVATAPGLGMVIVGQAVAGIGAAFILPNSVALLGVTFTEPHSRTEAISIWAASSGIGLAAGPLIAGVLLNHFSWHAVFLSNPVLAVITLAVTVPIVAESRQSNAGPLDIPGLVLGTTTIGALVFALIEGGHRGYLNPVILGVWAVAVIAGVLFVVVESRRAAPMLDVRLFRSFSFSAVMVVAAISLFGFTGVTLLQVLFFQRVQHLSALDTGWRLLVEMAAYIVVAGVSGRLIRRVGFKLPLVLGLVVGGLASLALVTQQPGSSFSTLWPLLALFGAGCGLVVAPSTAAAMVSVGPAQAGMASGAVNTARQVGTVIGTSILGTLLTSRLIGNLPAELASRSVPEGARGSILSAVESGATATRPLPPGAGDAIAAAFTSGVHAGVVTNGVVFLVAAVVALIGVHNRPHHR